MCLTSYNGEQTATDDRTVYKIVGKDNYSQFQSFQYEAGKRYQLDGRLVLKPCHDIDGLEMVEIQEGFRAYQSLDEAMFNMNAYFGPISHHKIVALTIPKGAHYVLGIDEDIVSDEIVAGTLEEVPCA